MESLRDKTAKGIMWGGLSNGMIQLLGMLFGIILLRLLTPDDYGKIAVLLIFSNIANSLQESGFIAALCNRKNPTDEEYNAVFWFNILVSITLYVILWFASPFIARFYHEPVLTNLARFLFLGFVISAAGTVQRAYLFGHMLVKQNSIISIIALVISNTIGVIMAWQGFAFWGLATQSVSYIAIVQIGCWSVSSWRPTFHINLRPAFQMFGFTSKLLVTYLFNQLNSQVLSVLLGRFYSPTIVGYYSNARKWDDMATTTINGMLSGVAQPVLAQITNDDSRYRMVFRKMLRFISFISFPCMIGLGLISHEFILIVIGSKWEESSTLLSMLCLYGAFFPISTLYSSMAVSRGKSGINMFCTISLCILVWIGLVIISPLGFYYMLAFFITINILWLLVWQYFAWKLIRLSLIDALKDVIPFFIFSSVVMATTWYLTINITNIY
ncbi:MAG: lipopolysaccharide biosynthesis protein, partial [Prevotellaceae bacterium]|nr:lipopolysaccharide biosynthesis protein [Candidatus Faecinaster equi]